MNSSKFYLKTESVDPDHIRFRYCLTSRFSPVRKTKSTVLVKNINEDFVYLTKALSVNFMTMNRISLWDLVDNRSLTVYH